MVLYKMKDTFPRQSHRSGGHPNPQNTTVVVSRWKADTSWTQKLAALGYRVIVYEHGTNPNSPYNLPVNVGREASAYTRYMRDYYDNLTLYTVFVHDEEFSWHHEGSLVDLIQHKLTTLYSPKYVNLNNRCTGSIYNNMWPIMKKYFDKYLEPYIGNKVLYGDWTLGNRCCAQCLVHRDRIKKHPKKLYEDLYTFFISPKKNDVDGKGKGHLFEWTLSLIFDSPVLYPRKTSTRGKHDPITGGPCPQPINTGIRSKALGLVKG